MPNPQKAIKHHWTIFDSTGDMCAYCVANTLAEATDIIPATYTIRPTVVADNFSPLHKATKRTYQSSPHNLRRKSLEQTAKSSISTELRISAECAIKLKRESNVSAFVSQLVEKYFEKI
jgi:ribosomal protein L28